MKKDNLLILFLSLGLCFLISCSDDDNNGGDSNTEKYLLSKLTEVDDSFEMRYHYDAQNRIIKEEEDEMEEGISTAVYEYNADNNPVKKTESHSKNDDTYLTTYTYKKDSIFVKMFETNSDKKISTIDTLIVDGNGYLKKINSSYGGYIAYSTYTYNNAGQLTQVSYYNKSSQMENSGTENFSYDKKTGYFSHVNIKPWFLNYEFDKYRNTNVSNPLLATSSSENKHLETGEILTFTSKTEYTYTYNEEGYPITMSEKYTYGNTTETENSRLEYVKAK